MNTSLIWSLTAMLMIFLCSMSLQAQLPCGISCPGNATISVPPGTCTADYNIPAGLFPDQNQCSGAYLQLAPVVGVSMIPENLNPGDDFNLPLGIHTLNFRLVDNTGSIIPGSQCAVVVTVVEPLNTIACNNSVQISLGDGCKATITPDMVLEGGPYCYDYYEITIEGVGSNVGSMMVTAPGTYSVTMTAPSGLSCWGTIIVEDKTLPELDCEDVEVFCSQDQPLEPGDIIYGYDDAEFINQTVGSGSTVDLPFTIASGAGSTIADVFMELQIEAANVSLIDVYLQSPGNSFVHILDLDLGTAHCTNSNLDIDVFDGAANAHSDFFGPGNCLDTYNAFIGAYRPLNSFASEFDGEDAQGQWMLRISNGGTSNLWLKKAKVRVTTNEGQITDSGLAENGCGPYTMDYKDLYVGPECANGYWNVIKRTWTVTNQSSGISSSCVQNIKLKRWHLDQIIWPHNYDDIDYPVLNCEILFDLTDWTLDPSIVNSDTIPLPVVTGRPGVPFGEVCDNWQMSYTDTKLGICGKYSFKVVRKWTVLDWCTGEVVDHNQIIKVLDRNPIVLTCAPDDPITGEYEIFTNSNGQQIGSYVTTTKPYSCTGDWTVKPPIVIDNSCDPHDLYFDIYYLLADEDGEAPVDGEYIQTNVRYGSDGNPEKILDLPMGRTWIKYYVEDDCGNTGECFTEVTVVDKVVPNPVCIEFTIVALGEDGCAKLHAESIDNGSWDNCGIDGFMIKKDFESASQYRDYVEYCCSDWGEERLVHLKVTDTSGNTNTCEVVVHIQDNLPPVVLSQPQNQFYNCGSGPVHIGDVINDFLDDFEVVDNCSASVSLVDPGIVNDVFDGNDCGEGTYTIKYKVEDICGNELPVINQTLTMTNPILDNPGAFTVTRWPSDMELNNCSTLEDLRPENLSQNADDIIVNTSVCDGIAITYDDQVFHNVDGACLKILRTWTVIDWCIVSANGNNLSVGTRTDVQVIKVFDSVEPEIAFTPVVTAEGFDSDCSVSTNNDSLLIISATDACTDLFNDQQLIYSYQVIYEDGTIANGTGANANGTYPWGTHTIRWYVEDHCGNVATQSTTLRIIDVKAPTPYCLGSAVTATMSNDGPVGIWARDFVLGNPPYDNKTGVCDTLEVDIYFLNENGQKVDGLEFDCDDIPNGISQIINLEVYFEDEAGNKDFCVVQLFLQDNESDVCEDNDASMAAVTGQIQTEHAESVGDVMVEISSDQAEFPKTDLTGASGQYAFSGLLTGHNYKLVSEKNDDPMNGVSTLDIVLIQRHILGFDPLDSPYKIIAADADNSKHVSAIDLITLRKIILGISMDFPNGQESWRFVDSDYQFSNPQNPFPFDESIDLIGLSQDQSGKDFIAVKIGDVNASATLNAQDEFTEKRDAEAVTLYASDIVLQESETQVVPVYARNFEDLYGLQFTLDFDPSAIMVSDIEPGALTIDRAVHIGWTQVEDGMLAFSWNDASPVQVDDTTPLFNIVLTAQKDVSIKEVLNVSSKTVRAEAYDSNYTSKEIAFEFDVDLEDGELVVYQNVPNPFDQSTEIAFSLPKASDVVFTVFDVNGRVLIKQSRRYNSGNHSIVLTSEELNSAGVMYYQLETEYSTVSKKMIQMR